MKLYLYIDGTLMPMPPSSVSVTAEGGSDYIRVSDGRYHVFSAQSAPEKISLELTVPDSPHMLVYRDSELTTPDLVRRHVMARTSSPFELVLLGTDGDGSLIYDVNVTAVSERVAAVHREGGITVTLEARRCDAAEVSA